MSDAPNGTRPRASTTSVINLALGVAAVATLLGGGVASVVSITNALAEVRGDVMVLKSQMSDVRSDVHEVVKTLRAAK